MLPGGLLPVRQEAWGLFMCMGPGVNFKSDLQEHLFSSVQFSRSVMPDSLRPHESQQARPVIWFKPPLGFVRSHSVLSVDLGCSFDVLQAL